MDLTKTLQSMSMFKENQCRMFLVNHYIQAFTSHELLLKYRDFSSYLHLSNTTDPSVEEGVKDIQEVSNSSFCPKFVLQHQ